jgi:Cof subfamily protein (haloacid dehalogenase superfamily)
MHPIQLLVLDIDGTIAGHSNTIREPVKQAVKQAQARGIQVAIATGRMYRSALRFYHDLGTTLPLMAYQGGLIKSPSTHEIHRHWTVPPDLVWQLVDYYEQPHLRDQVSVHIYIDDHLYVRELTGESKEYADRSGVEAIAVGDLRSLLAGAPSPHPASQMPPTKVLATCEDTDLIAYLFRDLRDRYPVEQLYLTTSVATFVEATNPLVNKGTAVRYLAEDYLGLAPENVMAIGDNFNDLEMIQYAGIGIAMGNAPAAVQANADWVAPDVEADGVATAIQQFLL